LQEPKARTKSALFTLFIETFLLVEQDSNRIVIIEIKEIFMAVSYV
jgi:hypothetical protein